MAKQPRPVETLPQADKGKARDKAGAAVKVSGKTVDGTMDTQRTTTERKKFRSLDRTITKGMSTFGDVGRALFEIQERTLYRESYKTFADFVDQQLL